jgi:transposase InsO family protein
LQQNYFTWKWQLSANRCLFFPLCWNSKVGKYYPKGHNHIKSIFMRHGIPDTFVSDNGPQYTSSVFEAFSMNYGFRHQTSHLHYPQRNGEAERTLQSVKCLIRKATDPYLALLSYRASPLKNWSCPAEL